MTREDYDIMVEYLLEEKKTNERRFYEVRERDKTDSISRMLCECGIEVEKNKDVITENLIFKIEAFCAFVHDEDSYVGQKYPFLLYADRFLELELSGLTYSHPDVLSIQNELKGKIPFTIDEIEVLRNTYEIRKKRIYEQYFEKFYF